MEEARADVAETGAVLDRVDERRAAVGLGPLARRPAPSTSAASTSPAATPSPTPSPTTISGTTSESAAQTVAYVEDVLPDRSTGLLVALVGGVVALLLLIAREWSR